MGTAGILGVDYDPLLLTAAGRPPENTELSTDEKRFHRRLGLLDRLQGDYANHGGQQEVSDHQKIYAQAARLVLSPKMTGFDLDKEPQKVKDAYGSGPFAQGCLLARRLIETGVTFVEVSHGPWDTHQDNFNRTKTLNGQIDQPIAALLADLKSRGLFDSTLVIWTGEFGRTPRINPNSGRDHFPRAFTSVLAGGGVKGGQVIGSTDAGGEAVKDRPVSVNDLLRTACHALAIDADKQNMSSIGRPIKIVDGGEVVKEVFSG
jgi:arylsulfatase A-like enzyme